jgi:hypothetical protein
VLVHDATAHALLGGGQAGAVVDADRVSGVLGPHDARGAAIGHCQRNEVRQVQLAR